MKSSQLIEINGQRHVHHRLSFKIDPIDPLSWLEEQTLYPKIFWHPRHSDVKIAGVGEAVGFQEIPIFSLYQDPRLRLFGGSSFSDTTYAEDLLWRGFPQCYFFLPSFELHQRKEHCELIVNLVDEDLPFQPEDLLKKIHFNVKASGAVPHFFERQDTPNREEWQTQILQCLKMIQQKELQKIVWARCTTLSFEEPHIKPFEILSLLKSPTSTLFGLAMSKELAFIGATPENLYERQGEYICSDVLAGTRPRGQTPDEDEDLKRELQNNEKEKREFQIVKDFLYSAFLDLCHSIDVGREDKIMSTSTVHHLYNHFSGKLKLLTTDRDLIRILHPTPSIGGYPRSAALHHIAKEESFKRGWYAAPFGLLSPKSAELAVGIRSALVRDHKLHLFAGLGIVEGSNPQKEWEELEHKISQFTRLFKKSLAYEYRV